MKVIADTTRQTQRYGDHRGKHVIALDEGDDADAIIADLTQPRQWYEKRYSNPRRATTFTDYSLIESKTHEGNLLVFDTFEPYLD